MIGRVIGWEREGEGLWKEGACGMELERGLRESVIASGRPALCTKSDA